MSLVALAIAILIGAAGASLLLMRRGRESLLVGVAAIAAAGTVSTAAAISTLTSGAAPDSIVLWDLPIGKVALSMDALSAWFVLTIGVLSVASAIYAWGYMQEEAEHRPVGVFSACLCLMVASMLALVCAADTVLFLLAWEMMSLSAFFLVGFHDEDEKARRAAWMYLVATHLGTALCVVPMFAMLWAGAGSSRFADFSAAFAGAPAKTCVVLFSLGLIGFGTKAGFMPMHVWLPHAHPVAPTPVSALLSGVMIKTGIYGILRLLSWLPPLPIECGMAMLAMGIISGVMGVLYAIAQHDIKRLLAYHSVENIGIIGLGIGIGMVGQSMNQPAIAAIGFAGAMLHVLNHALFKGLLFLSAGAVIHATGTGEIDRLGALIRRMPTNAILFLIAAISICGLPPFNGFVSEWLIYGGLFSSTFSITGPSAPMAVLSLTALALMGGLALACFAKVFSVVFLGEPRDATLPAHETPVSMTGAMWIPAILCIVIGVAPALIVPLTRGGASIVAHIPSDAVGTRTNSILAPMGTITLLVAVFGAILAGLAILRWRRRAAYEPRPDVVGTWGCGYAYPLARAQYTASSFAWSLVTSFKGVLWPQRKVHRPEGYFPKPGHVHTHTGDAAENELFAPIFRCVARLAAMVRTVSWSGEAKEAQPATGEARPLRQALARLAGAIRRGNIQVCVTYIVLTLVVLFVVEGFSTPTRRAVTPTTQPSASVPLSSRQCIVQQAQSGTRTDETSVAHNQLRTAEGKP